MRPRGSFGRRSGFIAMLLNAIETRSPSGRPGGFSNENFDASDFVPGGGGDAGVRSGAGGGVVAGWDQGGGDWERWAAPVGSGRKVDAAAGEGCAEGGVVFGFES